MVEAVPPARKRGNRRLRRCDTAKAPPGPKLTVKLPSGITVRGTDAAQVAELIKRLGC